jgi:hypothetical protein
LADALLTAQGEEDFDQVVALAVQIIASLLVRGNASPPYGRFEIGEHFLETYEINLGSLHRLSIGAWDRMSAQTWIKWLAEKWGLQVHFRVALRKLRYQTQDTFRIIPLDEGLFVREAPTARWSSPRLFQAFRFLYDLGALDDSKSGAPGIYLLTSLGTQLLEGELERA